MDLAFLRDFASGWGAGCLGLLVGHPFDTIKTNQQVGNAKIQEVVKMIWRRDGFRGKYVLL